MSSKQRDRGRILTPDGLSRLQQAIRAWELEHEVRCTQERIKELTSAVKEGGLDPGTIRKILKAKDGVDPESIRCLFTTFGLQLAEADLVLSSRLQIQADPNFVGREGAIADLNALVNRGAKVIVIQARGGVGKTTLARKYLQQEFGSFLEFPIAKETKDIASIESLIEEKLRQLGEEPGREFFVSLDRLKRKLQDERIGILIDNLEPALDAGGKFIEPHRRYVELLRVLTDPSVQAVTLITSRERLNEYSISIQHYLLGELSLEAWNQFFQNRFAIFASAQKISADDAALTSLHKAYGGNAKAMDILCGAVLTDYSGKIESFWQANHDDLLIERALEDLVVGQFNRLQTLDVEAYKLLCRMGCYRYQDVPTVPIEGLFCLLWDVPDNRKRRVVKALQERSLVEFVEGEFWLHPVIRGEAIDRLRKGVDWEISNREAAKFWTGSSEKIETIRDAIRGFEAYYQYLEIKDFEQAGLVIFEARDTQFTEEVDLGRFLSRSGLIQLTINSVNAVLCKISSEHHLSMLYDLIAVSHRMIGNVHLAIECHEKAIEMIQKYRSIIKSADGNPASYEDEEWVETNNFMNSGLCKIDLLEFEEAQSIFSNLKQTLPENNHHTPIIESCLIYLSSCIKPHGINPRLIDYIYNKFEENNESSGKGFRLIFLGMAHKNLGGYDSSLKMYIESVKHSERLGYPVTRAVALTCIGEISREKGDLKSAVKLHSESIESLSQVGAICDLAKAHYQLGLTYQVMGEVEKSDENFQEAIRLFSVMEAPKQVERVRRSMLTDSSK